MTRDQDPDPSHVIYAHLEIIKNIYLINQSKAEPTNYGICQKQTRSLYGTAVLRSRSRSEPVLFGRSRYFLVGAEAGAGVKMLRQKHFFTTF